MIAAQCGTEATVITGKQVRPSSSGMLLACLLLLLLILSAYSGSFAVGLCCDDFDHLGYLYRIVQGDYGLILKSLTGCFLDAPSYGLHYRPLLQFAYLPELFFRGIDAVALHTGNVVYHWLCSSLIYFVGIDLINHETATHMQESQVGAGQRLTHTVRPSNSVFNTSISAVRSLLCAQSLPAFVAACLFAVHPMHGEVVNFIVARVDTVCCFWLLVSFWCLLQSAKLQLTTEQSVATSTPVALSAGNARLRGASLPFIANKAHFISLIAYAIALGMKETALLFPLWLLAFEKILRGKSWRDSIHTSASYVVLLVLFLFIRTNALHMLLGGYLSHTDHLSLGVIRTFLGVPVGVPFLTYLLFPVSEDTRIQVLAPLIGLAAGYITLLVARLRLKKTASELELFFASWFLLALIPIVPVFQPFGSLVGNRMLYIPLIPLTLMWTTWGCGLLSSKQGNHRKSKLLGGTAIVLMTICFICMSNFNTSLWQTSTRISKKMTDDLAAFAAKHSPAPVVVVDFPRRYHASHIQYMPASLQSSFRPPFSNYTPKVELRALEPNWFMEHGFVNMSALRTRMNEGNSVFCNLELDGDTVSLTPLTLVEPPKVVSPVVMSQGTNALRVWMEKDTQYITAKLPHPVNPLAYPLIKLSLGRDFSLNGPSREKSHGAGGARVLPGAAFLFVRTPEMSAFTSARVRGIHFIVMDDRTVLIPASEVNCWVTSAAIDQLCLSVSLKEVTPLSVDSVQLCSDEKLVARLQAGPGMTPGPNGTWSFRSAADAFCTYNVASIPGAVAAEAEVSGPFSRISGLYRDVDRSFNVKDRMVVAGRTGRIPLPLNFTERSRCRCWYSLRVYARDCRGDLLGLSSDPIFIGSDR